MYTAPRTWHPHIYEKPPGGPTSHCISDILGFSKEDSNSNHRLQHHHHHHHHHHQPYCGEDIHLSPCREDLSFCSSSSSSSPGRARSHPSPSPPAVSPRCALTPDRVQAGPGVSPGRDRDQGSREPGHHQHPGIFLGHGHSRVGHGSVSMQSGPGMVRPAGDDCPATNGYLSRRDSHSPLTISVTDHEGSTDHRGKTTPGKQPTVTQCWFNVGPVGQRWTSTESTSLSAPVIQSDVVSQSWIKSLF